MSYNPYYIPASQGPSTGSSALSGAATGKQIGGMIPIPGAGVAGAAIGAIVGAGASIHKKNKERNANRQMLGSMLDRTNTGDMQTDITGKPIFQLDQTESQIMQNAAPGIQDQLRGVAFMPGRKAKRAQRLISRAQKAQERTRKKIGRFNTENLGYSETQQAGLAQQAAMQERANRLYNIPQQYGTLA